MSKQKKTEVKIEECLRQLDDKTEKWKRAVADYENLQKRVEQERKALMTVSLASTIAKFLPVLDNLESATAHHKDKGLSQILGQFRDILEKNGVVEINETGVPFDITLHDAVELVEDEDDNRVVKIVMKGYKLGDIIIRPAQVIVSKSEERS